MIIYLILLLLCFLSQYQSVIPDLNVRSNKDIDNSLNNDNGDINDNNKNNDTNDVNEKKNGKERKDYLYDDALGLYYAGDFCSYRIAGVEAAVLSGINVAEHIIAQLK